MFIMGNQILLVDDNQDLLDSMQDSLDIHGYTTITANNGKEAIDVYQKMIPCIVFMDIKMPVMDGYEAFSKIMRVSSDAKVVLVTGYDIPEKVQNAKNQGLLKILSKPVSTEQIISTIKENNC